MTNFPVHGVLQAQKAHEMDVQSCRFTVYQC